MKPFIPRRATWYIAEMIVAFYVEGNGAVVHVNLVLISATDPEEAYRKAMVLGEGNNAESRNDEGRRVLAVFHGLKNLHVIYDALEDGAELLFEEYADLTEVEIQDLVRPKEKLNVFDVQ